MAQQKKPMNNFQSSAAPAATKLAASTEIRNSAVPPRSATSAASKREVAWDQIAKRAYEIWQSRGGNETDNWLQAERELRAK